MQLDVGLTPPALVTQNFSCEILILLLAFISIREIIAITLTMAKITEAALVDGLDTRPSMGRGSRPIYEVSSFSHGKRYRKDLSDADNMLGHKN